MQFQKSKIAIASLVTLLFISTKTYSASGIASSGEWNVASTWNFSGVSRIPACGDTLVIPHAITVGVSYSPDFGSCSSPFHLIIDGKLDFNTGNSMILPCFSVIDLHSGGQIKRTGANHTSTYIKIYDTVVFSGANGNLHGPANLSGCSTLPVSILYFSGKQEEDKLKFEWASATEVNNDFFTVECSLDGMDFTKIGKIKGSGNSSATIEYKYIFDYPFSGVTYYRLKQTDFDGRYAYSDIIAVSYKNKKKFKFETCTYENQFLKIKYVCDEESEFSATITNLSGQKFYESKFMLSGSDEFGIPHFLPKGIYVIALSNNSTLPFTKMFIVE